MKGCHPNWNPHLLALLVLHWGIEKARRAFRVRLAHIVAEHACRVDLVTGNHTRRDP